MPKQIRPLSFAAAALGLLACTASSPPTSSPSAKPDAQTTASATPTPAASPSASASTTATTAPSTLAAPQKLRAAPARVATELFARPLEDAFVDDTTSPRSIETKSGPGPKTKFGLYILALTWEPSFCCQKPDKGQCDGITKNPGPFGADHLTLHGLWPNFTDAEAKAHGGKAYPAFCGQYASCSRGDAPAFCDPDHSTIPADMSTFGPGYVTDNYFLADHEWPKHGSCTGLGSGPYFQAAIDRLKALPGDKGTPDLLRKNIGGSVSRKDLAAAFGKADAVMMSCDKSCQLQQIEVCYAVDGNNMPTTLTTCPDNATKTPYDNSCAINKCDKIKLQKAGQCSSGGSGGGGSSSGGSSGGACSNPGQGPACTSDDSCVKDGYVRCAKSGCCTTIPK